MALLLAGCLFERDGEWKEDPRSGLPAYVPDCVPSYKSFSELERVHRAAADPINFVGEYPETVADIARAFRQVLVVRALHDQAPEEQNPPPLISRFPLASLVSSAAKPDGTYRQPSFNIGEFTVSVFDPSSGEQVTHDILAFDSYFEGVELTVDAPYEELAQIGDEALSFTLRWHGRGPLADAIDPDHELESPLTFTASLAGLEGLDPVPGLEPLDAILDFEVEWSIDFAGKTDRVSEDGTLVEVIVPLRSHGTSERLPLRERVRDPGETIEYGTIHAEDAAVDLDGSAEIEYVGDRFIEGTVVYDLESRDARVRITDTYAGEVPRVRGNEIGNWPGSTWSCLD